MRSNDLRVALLLGALGVGLAPASVAAEDCNVVDLAFALPRDGASGVPTDATLRAVYGAGASYAGEAIVLRSGSRSIEFDVLSIDLAGRPALDAEGALVVRPRQPLQAETVYEVQWPGLAAPEEPSDAGTEDAGSDAGTEDAGVPPGTMTMSTPGRGATVRFTTGPGADAESPAFGGVTAVDWEYDRPSDVCIGSRVERYLFKLSHAQATDDGPAANLRFQVFQSRGPNMGTDEAPRQILSVPFQTTPVEVHLPRSAGLGTVCFALQAVDLTGKRAGASQERCTTTVAPPIWEGCQLVPGADRGWSGWPLLLLLALLVRTGRRATAVAALGLCLGCDGTPDASVARRADVAGALCADVGPGRRACWTDQRGQWVDRRRRSAPHCSAQGDTMRCESSEPDSGHFRCKGTVCRQAHPRLPDSGEWECVQVAGVLRCAGGASAAGVVPAPVSASFVCGDRRRHEGERVCVDLAPTPPPAGFDDCKVVHEPRPVRVCQRGGTAAVGQACSAQAPCVDGCQCVEGFCLPPRPVADCWLDADCESGVCRFGSCLGRG